MKIGERKLMVKKRKAVRKAARKAPKAPSLRTKRVMSPAERKKLGVALARVKGKTTGYDPTVYEPKGRSHSPNMTGAKDVVDGVDKYTGNKVYGLNEVGKAGKAGAKATKAGSTKKKLPNNQVSGGGVQAADTYLMPEHIRQEPGWERTLDRIYRRYGEKQGGVSKFSRDLETLRRNAQTDHGNATENREAQRAFIAYREAGVDLGLIDRDEVPELGAVAHRGDKRGATAKVPTGDHVDTPETDTPTVERGKTTPTATATPTTGKTRNLNDDKNRRRRALTARRKYQKLADEDNQKARDELALIKPGDDEKTTAGHLEAYREHRNNEEINRAIAADANTQAEYARLHLDRLDPDTGEPEKKEAKELTEEEQARKEEAKAKARATREANKAARDAELEAQRRQGTEFDFLRRESLERAEKNRAAQAKHLELAEKYQERGETEKAQKSMLRYERAVRAEHRNRVKAAHYETEHEYEKHGLTPPSRRHSDEKATGANTTPDAPNTPENRPHSPQTEKPGTDTTPPQNDEPESDNNKDATNVPNEPDTVPNTDRRTGNAPATASPQETTSDRGDNTGKVRGKTRNTANKNTTGKTTTVEATDPNPTRVETNQYYPAPMNPANLPDVVNHPANNKVERTTSHELQPAPEDTKDALTGIIKATGDRRKAPILAGVNFKRSEDGTVEVAASDQFVFHTAKLDIELTGDIDGDSVLIDGKELAKGLKKVKANPGKLTINRKKNNEKWAEYTFSFENGDQFNIYSGLESYDYVNYAGLFDPKHHEATATFDRDELLKALRDAKRNGGKGTNVAIETTPDMRRTRVRYTDKLGTVHTHELNGAYITATGDALPPADGEKPGGWVTATPVFDVDKITPAVVSARGKHINFHTFQNKDENGNTSINLNKSVNITSVTDTGGRTNLIAPMRFGPDHAQALVQTGRKQNRKPLQAFHDLVNGKHDEVAVVDGKEINDALERLNGKLADTRRKVFVVSRGDGKVHIIGVCSKWDKDKNELEPWKLGHHEILDVEPGQAPFMARRDYWSVDNRNDFKSLFGDKTAVISRSQSLTPDGRVHKTTGRGLALVTAPGEPGAFDHREKWDDTLKNPKICLGDILDGKVQEGDVFGEPKAPAKPKAVTKPKPGAKLDFSTTLDGVKQAPAKKHTRGKPFETKHLTEGETLEESLFGGQRVRHGRATITTDKDGYTVTYPLGVGSDEVAHVHTTDLNGARQFIDRRQEAIDAILTKLATLNKLDREEMARLENGDDYGIVVPDDVDKLVTLYDPYPRTLNIHELKGNVDYSRSPLELSDDEVGSVYAHGLKQGVEDLDEWETELENRGYDPKHLGKPRTGTEEMKKHVLANVSSLVDECPNEELTNSGITRRETEVAEKKPPTKKNTTRGKTKTTTGGKASGKASSKPKTTKREDKPATAGGNSGDDGGKKPPTPTTTTGGEHNDKDNNGENLTPEQKEAKEKAEKLKKLVENYEASVNEASRNPVAKLDGINTYDDVTSGEKQKDLYYSLVTMGRNDPVAMRNQLDKVVERVEPEFWDRRDELAEIKPYVTKKYDPDDPNATDLGEGDKNLRKQRVTVAKEVATEISEKLAEQDRRETPGIVSAIMEAGGTPAGLQFRVKTHASIVSKLHRKAKDKYKFDNPGEDGNNYEPSDLREMAGKVKDGFRFTAVVPKDGYTDKADELVRIMQRNGWTVTKPKHHEFGHYTWDSYPGLNLVFEKNGENVEIQVQTPYSFVAKNATHVAYDIARDGDEENPDIIRINQDQKTIFGCVPTPKNVANKHYIENPLENREEDKKWQPSTTRETSLSSKTTDKNSGVSTTQNLGTGNDTNGLKESTSAPTTTGSRNSPKRKPSKQSPKTSKNTTGSKSGLEKRTPTSSNGTTRTKSSHVDTSQATFKEINERLSKRGRVTVDGVEYDKPTTGLPEAGDLVETPEGWGINHGWKPSEGANPNAGYTVELFDNKGQRNTWHGLLGDSTRKRAPLNRGDGDGNGGSAPKGDTPTPPSTEGDGATPNVGKPWLNDVPEGRIQRDELRERGWDSDDMAKLKDVEKLPNVPENVSNKTYSLAEVEKIEKTKRFQVKQAKKADEQAIRDEIEHDVANPPSVDNPKPNGDTVPLTAPLVTKGRDGNFYADFDGHVKKGDVVRVINKKNKTHLVSVGELDYFTGETQITYLPEPRHMKTFRTAGGTWQVYLDKGSGFKTGDKITVKDRKGNEHVRVLDEKNPAPYNVNFDQFTLTTPAKVGNDKDGYKWTKRGAKWLIPVGEGEHKAGDKITVTSAKGRKTVYLNEVHTTEGGASLWTVTNNPNKHTAAEGKPIPEPAPAPELSTQGQRSHITALQAENRDVFVDPENLHNVGHWHENLRVILSPENFQDAKQRARHGYATYLWNQRAKEIAGDGATDSELRKAFRQASRELPMKDMALTDDMARYLIEHSVMAKRLEFEKALYATPEKLDRAEADRVIDVLDRPSVFTSKNFTEVKPIWLDALQDAVAENGMSKRELSQRLIIGDYWEGTVKGGAPSSRQLAYARAMLYRHMMEYGVGENDNLMLDSFTIANPWRYLEQLSRGDLSYLIDMLKNDSM